MLCHLSQRAARRFSGMGYERRPAPALADGLYVLHLPQHQTSASECSHYCQVAEADIRDACGKGYCARCVSIFFEV